MNGFANDFDNATGSVMSRAQLEDQRRKRGECVTCGRKCFQKKLFKTIPITEHGMVLNGRCLNCNPLDAKDKKRGEDMPAVSRRATNEDLERFNLMQSNLAAPQRSNAMAASRSASVRAPKRTSSRLNRTKQAASARTLTGAAPPRRSTLTSASSSNMSVSSGTQQSISSTPARLVETDEFSEVSQDLSANLSLKSPDHAPAQHLTRGLSMPAVGYTPTPSEERFEPLDDYIPAPPMEQNGGRLMDQNVSRYSLDQDSQDEFYAPEPNGRRYEMDYSDGHRPQIPHALLADIKHMNKSDYSVYSQDDDSFARVPIHDGDEIFARPTYGSQTSLRSGDSTASDDAMFREMRKGRVLDRGGTFKPLTHSSNSNRRIPRGSRSSHAARSSRNGSTRSVASVDSFEETASNGYSQKALEVHVEGHIEGHFDGHIEADEIPYDDSSYAEHAIPFDDPHQQHYDEHAYAEVDHVDGGESEGMFHLRNAGSDFVEVVNVMKDFVEDIDVQCAGLELLSVIQLTEEDSNVLSQIGGIDLIVHSMASYSSTLELQVHGCGAIWNAAGTAENQYGFVQAGVLDVLCDTMEGFIDRANLQEQAMAALANLAALEMNMNYMIERGVLKRVVEAMTRHNDNVPLLMKGCLVVANLSSHPTTMKQVMMEAGGGSALVIAMVMHPKFAELQEKALRGLRNLSANCDENKVEITNLGGIDAVVGALQVHRDEVGVQEVGAWTLSNLAGNPDSNALIGECGGIDVLIRAMWVHSDIVSVLEWCSRALFTLALNESNARLILEVGGIAAVVNAMQAHVDSSPVVQEMGCAVLTNLAVDARCKMRIVEEEALDAIVLAMVLYSDEVRVQERACQVLLRVAIAENLKAMQASNVSELVQVASEKFPDRCSEAAHRLLAGLESYIAQYG